MFGENCLENSSVNKPEPQSGTLHKDHNTFVITSRSDLPTIQNTAHNTICGGNENTFCVQQLFFENRVIYEKMWRNIVERGRTIWRIGIACWVPKSTNPHSEYVIYYAFPLQHLLHEHVSMLRHTYRTLLYC